MENFNFKEEEALWRKTLKSIEPSDFCISKDEADKMRAEYLRNEILECEEYESKMRSFFLKADNSQKWYIEMQLEEVGEELKKLKSKLYFTASKDYAKKSFDLEAIKQIPIQDIMDRPVYRSGSKRLKTLCINHNENTPSMYIFEDKNIAHCFGCGFHGSVIDVYMKLNSCSFVDACKSLA